MYKIITSNNVTFYIIIIEYDYSHPMYLPGHIFLISHRFFQNTSYFLDLAGDHQSILGTWK